MKTNLSKEMDSEMLFELVRKADTDKDAAFKLRPPPRIPSSIDIVFDR